MPNSETKKKAKAAPKAAWRITAIYVMLGALIFGVFWWARNNTQSEVAQQIRDLLGIHPAKQAAPEPQPEPIVVNDTPAPVVPQEPPPPPEPEDITWQDFVANRSIWPSELKIEIDPVVTLRYQGRSFGEMGFESGQILNVINFTKEGLAYGRTYGNELEIHVSATNFEEWFEQNHAEDYNLDYPKRVKRGEAEDFDEELITNLRIWSIQNYNTPLIEVQEDKIVLRLHSDGRTKLSEGYSLEAQSVARAYLRIQAELGGDDNYASCEIRDIDSGKLIGSKGIFIPRL